MPWVQPIGESATSLAGGAREFPELAGGNWLHGRRLFFGDQLACSRCHTLRGEGGRVGPDLSNLIQRDYASVRKDIEFPNAAINPDHVASVLELKDGDSLNVIVLSEANAELTVVDGSGGRKMIHRSDVKSVRPAQQSLMPEGLWAAITPEQQKDLMTFLLTEPLAPGPTAANVQGLPAPPPRPKADFARLMPNPGNPAVPSKPIRIILCASPKDGAHKAPGMHDYPLWQSRWSKLLPLADGVTVDTAVRWPDKEQWQRADVVVFYHDNPGWDKSLAPDLDQFLNRGGGLVFLHWSLNAYHDYEDLAARIGRAWGPGAAFRQGLEDVHFASHEITAGFADATFTDETYWNLRGAASDSQVLATAVENGAPMPQVWTRQAGSGRVMVCILGHFTWTFDDPLYRILVLRGIAWTARQPIDRLTELATVGARFSD
jgi:putative heme-binding domain-containing protein